MERRVRRKETSATTRPDDARVGGLCPILDGRALTCASPDHHFTSRMAAQGAPWNRPASPASLPKLKVGARPASAILLARTSPVRQRQPPYCGFLASPASAAFGSGAGLSARLLR